eukprot:754809-Hanusia_phi.AAC.5
MLSASKGHRPFLIWPAHSSGAATCGRVIRGAGYFSAGKPGGGAQSKLMKVELIFSQLLPAHFDPYESFSQFEFKQASGHLEQTRLASGAGHICSPLQEQKKNNIASHNNGHLLGNMFRSSDLAIFSFLDNNKIATQSSIAPPLRFPLMSDTPLLLIPLRPPELLSHQRPSSPSEHPDPCPSPAPPGLKGHSHGGDDRF